MHEDRPAYNINVHVSSSLQMQ